MKKSVASLVCAVALSATSLPALAVVTPFDLMGKAGAGLLGGNETSLRR